jgi:hypothetical protein
MSETITEKDKWVISAVSACVFLVLSLPVVYKLTGFIFKIVGVKTETGGCPNFTGLLLHAIVFAILIRLIMLIPIVKKEKYDGLVNPAAMKQYNTAYLESVCKNCKTCSDAAQECIDDPFGPKCSTGIQDCQKTCKDKGIVKTLKQAFHLSPVVDYIPKSGCPYKKSLLVEDPNIIT